MSKSKFVRNKRCFGCESTLMREVLSQSGAITLTCFTCGLGVDAAKKCEMHGLGHNEVLEILGREGGTAGQIYVRVNSPGKHLSQVPARTEAIEFVGNVFKSRN